MKKLVSLVLALCMVLMMGAAFADGTGNLTADTSISISGLDTGDVANFYRVLQFSDSASTTGGWVNAENVTLSAEQIQKIVGLDSTGKPVTITNENRADYGITSTLAGTIADMFAGKTPNYTANESSGTATVANSSTEPLVPGLYCILVTPAKAGTVYNPVFVACDYTRNSSNGWTVVNMQDTYSDSAMAKKIGITVVKTAAEASEAANETDGAKAVGVGDTINYTITTTIPEFADNYTAPLFVVSDTLSAGLTLVKNIVVTGMGADTYDITYPESGPDFKITFKPEELKKLTASTDITVTYSATVTESAITNVNEEDNTVEVEFSHTPDVTKEGDGKKVGDKTHHYTFTIDGKVWGDSERKTTEVVKVGVDADGNEITQTTTLSNGKTIGALQGAEFKLYIDAACTTEYNKGVYGAAERTTDGNKIVSDASGIMNIVGSTGISGLDAGTYYLKEEKAPDGYIKQQAATKIEIIPSWYGPVTWTENDITYTCDDLLKSYVVKIDGATTATYTVKYADMNADGTLPKNDHVSQATDDMYTGVEMTIGNSGPITTVEAEKQDTDDDGKVINPKGVELPSTGGIGTTIFYILGGLLVVGAAVILVARRKAQD